MPEKSRRWQGKCIRAAIQLRASLCGVADDPARIARANDLALDMSSDGMPFAEAIDAAWDLSFGATSPHPRRGTRWQRWIKRQHPGPLRFGKPDPEA